MLSFYEHPVHCMNLEVNKGITGLEPYSRKLRNMSCKVKEKQCFTDYVSYLYAQYFAIFLGYGSCPVKPLFTSNSVRSYRISVKKVPVNVHK
jgi:hypothetical protein